MLKELVDEQLVFLHPAVQGTTSRTRGESATGHVLIQRHQNLMGLLQIHKSSINIDLADFRSGCFKRLANVKIFSLIYGNLILPRLRYKLKILKKKFIKKSELRDINSQFLGL